MRTLDRYIAEIFLKNLFFAVIAMSLLFLSQAIFPDIYDHAYPMGQIFVYHLLNLPQICIQMAPPAVLLATVLTLSGLARTHELVACYAIGFGLKRLMALILVIVLGLSCMILVVEDRILPPVFKKRTNYYWRVMKNRPDFFLGIKRDKIWYRSRNMIYNLQRFDTHLQVIHGMTVYTFDDEFNLVQVISAKKAEYEDAKWRLFQGTVTLFTPEDPFPLSTDFKEKEILIPETPKEFQEIEKEVDGLGFKGLAHYIQQMKNAGADTKSYEVKLQSRFSLSFIPVVMCFLAVPFSVGSRREGGMAKDLSLCLAITFFYWLFYSVGLSLGSNGVLLPWVAAWLPSAVFMVLAGVLIARKA